MSRYGSNGGNIGGLSVTDPATVSMTCGGVKIFCNASVGLFVGLGAGVFVGLGAGVFVGLETGVLVDSGTGVVLLFVS